MRRPVFSVYDQLFKRSNFFRTLVIETFDEVVVNCIGTNTLKPLPPPKQSAKKLQSDSIAMFKRWFDNYCEGYSKLKICREAVKRQAGSSLKRTH